MVIPLPGNGIAARELLESLIRRWPRRMSQNRFVSAVVVSIALFVGPTNSTVTVMLVEKGTTYVLKIPFIRGE